MNEKASASSIRAKSRDQLLGFYSISIGSLAIMFAIIYFAMTIVSGVTTVMAFGRTLSGAGDATQMNALMSNPQTSILINILTYIMMAIVTPIISILTTGYLYICREISYGRRPAVSNLFYGFKNHPDKIIIMSLIIYGVQMILNIPLMLYENAILPDPSGKQFMIFAFMVVIQVIILIILSLSVALCFQVYLDEPEYGAVDCLKESIRMMKGNKWRLFYLMLSFIGYAFLALFSLGIALLWIIPYQNVSMVNFYRDIKESEQRGISIEN